MYSAFEYSQFREKMYKIILGWINTPYRHCTKVKGRGADCATFMAAIFEELGVIESFTVPYYAMDWHIHGQEDLFINNLEKFRAEVARPYILEPLPAKKDIIEWGDWLVFAMSPRGYANHSALYIGDGNMVHCTEKVGVRIAQCLDFWPKLSRAYRLYKGVNCVAT